ncbi:hypothetical protein Tco_1539738 [Tanacetum coccineum]
MRARTLNPDPNTPLGSFLKQNAPFCGVVDKLRWRRGGRDEGGEVVVVLWRVDSGEVVAGSVVAAAAATVDGGDVEMEIVTGVKVRMAWR